ncbi:ABC transporter substrate-binding protein [Paracoccus sp. DMF-8]|uniref:ABC transporter substrate-binding protein n=1 Tax=Paracoccus sp. DMF-8 TaxID=3019445 RepID=UPI0023E863EC|nr:ABC transporter substrate-binding protein [Paracoccus sp. DMF-8]MDF3606366.1 ABC transporter substrate-binding protein [Paracoccus sp. DMF-8]
MRLTATALVLTLSAAAASAQTTLTLYTSQSPEIAQQTADAFMAKHPEITVEWMRNGTSQLMNILAAEQQAGDIKADVLLVADSINLGTLKQQGLLMAWPDAPLDGIDPLTYDADKTFFGTKISSTGIVYNTTIAEPVTGWADLFSDANAGQIVAPSPLYSGAALVHMHSLLQDPAQGWAYYERLNELGVVPEGGNGPVLKAVAGGQVKYGVNIDADVLRAQKAGSPVEFIYPTEGATFFTEPAAILANTDQVEAARAFVAFVLSEDGQKLAAEQGYIPVNPKVASPEGMPALSEIKLLPLDADRAVAEDGDARARFTEIFGG